MEANKTINLEVKGALEVELGSVVSSNNVQVSIPTIIQTSGLPQDDALAFVKDCAVGKRKIAKAVRNKYEGTSGTASEITEYSTFDELSNKISQIPIEVPLGSAMEQNGGVLPFYDVYNEALKAMKEFAGYGFNGVCAFELDKWSYDNDNTITLSGASAYYTSDKGELITTDTEYQFKDIDQPNTNRFVVYFFDIEEGDKYQVPKSLPITSCLSLWCIKGTPLMNFNADFTELNSINVYDGELDAKDANDFSVIGLTMCQTMMLAHLKSYQHRIIGGNNLVRIALPNLTEIGGNAQPIVTVNNIKEMHFPKLKKTSSQLLNQAGACRIISAPELEEVTYTSGILYQVFAEEIYFPKLKKTSSPILGTSHTIKVLNLDSLEVVNTSTSTNAFLGFMKTEKVELPKLHKINTLYNGSNTNIPTIHLGDGMKDGIAGDIRIYNGTANTTLTTLTVAKGFKAKLNLTGCNGLERDVLLGIINNLADLTDTEYADKLQLILGTTLYNKLTEEDILIATNKHWLVS